MMGSSSSGLLVGGERAGDGPGEVVRPHLLEQQRLGREDL